MLPDEPASESVINQSPSSSPRRSVSRSPWLAAHAMSSLSSSAAQPVAQVTLQDLAGGVARQLVHEHDLLGLLVAGEVVLAERDQLGLGHIRARPLLHH